MAVAEKKDMIAIIARRPLFSSAFFFFAIVSGLTPEKSMAGKTMVGVSPPLR